MYIGGSMLFSLLSLNLPFYVLTAILVAYIVVLIFSLGSHEYAHALAAYRNGDMTAKNAGRMTMNPFAHFNAYGFVSLLLFGFGWADPVPVNPYYLTRGKKSLFQVSVAGITTNLVLAILFSLLTAALNIFAFDFLMSDNFFAILLYYIANLGMQINLSLAVFNILPLYPLDGSKMLELTMKPDNKVLTFLQRYSTLILLTLLLFGVISVIIDIAISFLGTGMITLWSLLFNLFV